MLGRSRIRIVSGSTLGLDVERWNDENDRHVGLTDDPDFGYAASAWSAKPDANSVTVSRLWKVWASATRSPLRHSRLRGRRIRGMEWTKTGL
jgi:hypothetical protein